ncbi:MAG: metallophosphoesterase [Bacteroidota bacterium]
MQCLFVSDLHGKLDRYEKLFEQISFQKPTIVLFGGDLLPHSFGNKNFIIDYLIPKFEELRNNLADRYPKILIILGNDDAAKEEINFIANEKLGLWNYIHQKFLEINGFNFAGYSYTPPSPFLLKDWEKYDVSRYVDPGCVSPEEGKRTVEIEDRIKKYSTIKNDLDTLSVNKQLTNAVILFHGPPYNTKLDRVSNDGKKFDHIPLDLHVGSIAIRNFIEKKQPLLTLHGHIHESSRLSGTWRDKIGSTHCLSAAYDGNEFAIIKFDLQDLDNAERLLI